MKIEVIFDYISDVVTKDGVVDRRILRNDYTIIIAENITKARAIFYKQYSGMITKINIIEE